jgi:hypothetical protein
MPSWVATASASSHARLGDARQRPGVRFAGAHEGLADPEAAHFGQ